MSAHVGLHNNPALAVKPDPRGRLHRRCAAIACGHAHADQPVPSPDLRRPGVALVPVERPRLRAGSAPGCGRRTLDGSPGTTSGSLRMWNATGSRPSFLGHFVHRHFQRHGPVLRPVRASHCLRACRAWRCNWPPGGWRPHELGRLQGAVFAILAVDVARPVLMGDGGDPAILSAADPHALEGGVPVRGVVGHQRALQRDLHRSPDCLPPARPAPRRHG